MPATPETARPFPPPTLDTPRLHLRPLQRDDAQAVFETYAADPEATRYLAFPTHRSVADAEGFARAVAAAWEAGAGHRAWAVERREDGRFLGAVGVDVDRFVVNVGYALGRAYWNHGYATEALRAIRDAVFADPGVWRFQAFHAVGNAASGRVMEKVGLQLEGVLRRYFVHPQLGPEPQDVVMRALTRDDWQTAAESR